MKSGVLENVNLLKGFTLNSVRRYLKLNRPLSFGCLW